MATKVCAINAVEAYPENRGTISAYILVEATGFNGSRMFKRVRIGYEFGVSVDTAKDMMKNIREANNSGKYDSSGPVITGRYTLNM
jgi:hypothetical protein